MLEALWEARQDLQSRGGGRASHLARQIDPRATVALPAMLLQTSSLAVQWPRAMPQRASGWGEPQGSTTALHERSRVIHQPAAAVMQLSSAEQWVCVYRVCQGQNR